MLNVFELHLSHHNHNHKARGHPPALSPVFVFVFIFVSLFVFVFIFIYVIAEVRLQPCPPLEDKLLTMIFLLRRMTAGGGIIIGIWICSCFRICILRTIMTAGVGIITITYISNDDSDRSRCCDSADYNHKQSQWWFWWQLLVASVGIMIILNCRSRLYSTPSHNRLYSGYSDSRSLWYKNKTRWSDWELRLIVA